MLTPPNPQELTTGVLPMVLLKMGIMDRDEHGDPRIPILMNYLSELRSGLVSHVAIADSLLLELRITDSVYPFHDRHAVFRIELECASQICSSTEIRY